MRMDNQTPDETPGETDALITDDLDQALGENESWIPPDAPHAVPTAAQQRGITDSHRQSDLEADARPAGAGGAGPESDAGRAQE
jgi:hypothetical protein